MMVSPKTIKIRMRNPEAAIDCLQLCRQNYPDYLQSLEGKYDYFDLWSYGDRMKIEAPTRTIYAVQYDPERRIAYYNYRELLNLMYDFLCAISRRR